MFLFVLQLDWRLEHTSLKQIFNFEFVVIETIFYDEDHRERDFPLLAGWRVANVVEKNKLFCKFCNRFWKIGKGLTFFNKNNRLTV